MLPSGWPGAELGLMPALHDVSLLEVLSVTDQVPRGLRGVAGRGDKDLSVTEKPALGQEFWARILITTGFESI